MVLGGFGNKVSQLFYTSHVVVIIVSAISQLRVLASHKTNFESVAQRCLGIRHVAIWEVPFLSDPCLFGYIF